jgi:hypothetical protein
LLEHSRAEDPRTKALIAASAGALRVSNFSTMSPFLVSTVQMAQQVDVEVITGIHMFDPRQSLSTRSNTSNKEIFPNVRKASPIR